MESSSRPRRTVKTPVKAAATTAKKWQAAKKSRTTKMPRRSAPKTKTTKERVIIPYNKRSFQPGDNVWVQIKVKTDFSSSKRLVHATVTSVMLDAEATELSGQNVYKYDVEYSFRKKMRTKKGVNEWLVKSNEDYLVELEAKEMKGVEHRYGGRYAADKLSQECGLFILEIDNYDLYFNSRCEAMRKADELMVANMGARTRLSDLNFPDEWRTVFEEWQVPFQT